jgi:hypothetical protein
MIRRRFFGGTIATLFFATLGIVSFGQENNPLRTPLGELRAGTTLTMRATAFDTTMSMVVATSSVLPVRIGQVGRLQLTNPNLNALSLGTSGGWLPLSVENRGNGDDQFAFEFLQMELTQTLRWTVEFYEDRNGDGIGTVAERIYTNAGTVNGGLSSMIEAFEQRPFLAKLVPPSDTQTDGVDVRLACSSVANPQQTVQTGLMVGVEATVARQSTASTASDRSILANPALYNGRLYWIATNETDSRLYFTLNPVFAPGSTLVNNRSDRSPNLVFIPQGFSKTCGSGWFVGRSNGDLARFDLAQLDSGATLAQAMSIVQFPTGARPVLSIEPASFRDRLYVVASDNRLYPVMWDGQLRTPSLPILNGAISSTPLATDRWIAIGTEAGWLNLLDVGTGLFRWSTRVFNNQSVSHPIIMNARRSRLYAASGNKLTGVMTGTGVLRWTFIADSNIVSPPFYDAASDSIFFITANRTLYSIDANNGQLKPLYPQTIFGTAGNGSTLTSARMEVLTRTDRRTPYLYIVAQQQLSDNSSAGVLAMVATRNPVNRFYASNLTAQSELLPSITITSGEVGSLIFLFQKQAPSEKGRIYAFTIR